MAEGIFDRYPVAKWEVKGKPALTFPFELLEENGGNRLAPHERLYRDGARVDDTGASATTYTFTISVFNSPNHEEGVDGLAQYPDLAIALIESCLVHETGTLTVPTKGPRRCRAHTWRRMEDATKVDMAGLVITWMEDNEDDAEVAAAQAPSASAVAAKFAQDALDAGQGLGLENDNLSSLTELAADLEHLANAPSQFVADIEAKSGNLVASVDRIGDTMAAQGDLFGEPDSSRTHRQLNRLRDVAARAPAEPHEHLGRIVNRTFTTAMSIFDVATVVGQDVTDLIPLNSQLPDLLRIERDTPVRVFA